MKNCPDFVVPMFRAVAQTVECTFQQPVFAVFGIGIAIGGFVHCNLVWWQNSLAERVLTITLLKSAPASYGHAYKSMECVGVENWSVLVGLGPDTIFMVPKDNNPSFCLVRV